MRRLLGDIRALGMWAPVRVVYEVMRRLGILGRLLQAASRRVEAPPMSSPFPMGAVIGQALGWAGAADDILSQPLHIFGRDVTIGDAPDWHTDGNDHAWPQDPAWRLDLYSDERRDVKHVWETARHRHLVILARAAAEFPEKNEGSLVRKQRPSECPGIRRDAEP